MVEPRMATRFEKREGEERSLLGMRKAFRGAILSGGYKEAVEMVVLILLLSEGCSWLTQICL
ncbi:hypothetical protein IC582_015230 [Cucumis melo]